MTIAISLEKYILTVGLNRPKLHKTDERLTNKRLTAQTNNVIIAKVQTNHVTYRVATKKVSHYL